jgi:hypothetical protein
MKKIISLIFLTAVSMFLSAWENQDWIIEYDWYLEDGRDVDNPRADHVYWHSHRTPFGVFKKLDIPSNSVIYRQRLRNDVYYYFYQTNDKNKLFPIGGSNNTHFDVMFYDNFSSMSSKRGNTSYGYDNRTGGQYNPEHPLLGIWGALPALLEYRLVAPDNYVFSLDIDKEIPGWAVPEGTYIFKQTGDKVFETDSSFPDGRLRLEIRRQDLLLLVPLYTAPSQEGLTAPLALRRIPKGQR